MTLDSPQTALAEARRWPAGRVDITRVTLRGWLAGFLLAAALVVVCYTWVDRPVARLMNATIVYNPFWRLFTHLPDLLTLLAFAILIVVPLLAWRAGGWLQLARMEPLAGALLAGGSFVLSTAMKLLLKWAFSRTWPETWIDNNLSYMRDGVYGFFPFHGGGGYGSFPSGHMTGVMSIVVVGWHFWPRLAPIWIIAAAGAAAGLIVMDFHFVSDVIAGAYLGSACGAAVLWMAGERRSRS